MKRENGSNESGSRNTGEDDEEHGPVFVVGVWICGQFSQVHLAFLCACACLRLCGHEQYFVARAAALRLCGDEQ